MVSPVLILLICGGIELGHYYTVWMTLEGATLEAARSTTALQEKTAAEREVIIRAGIQNMMLNYPLQDNQAIDIQIKSYADFASASTPEPFRDMNGNGKYDGPGSTAPDYPGEPYTDKNANGVWDSVSFKDRTNGGTGEVVSYVVTFPAAPYFPFLEAFGMNGVTLQTTAVTRNEPVKITAGGV